MGAAKTIADMRNTRATANRGLHRRDVTSQHGRQLRAVAPPARTARFSPCAPASSLPPEGDVTRSTFAMPVPESPTSNTGGYGDGMQDKPVQVSDRTWHMWAIPRGEQFSDPGDRRYAKHFSSEIEPVPVVLTEDPDGPYWGWLPAEEQIPTMIHPRRSLFRMCFHYGPEAEQAAGRGRIVRFQVSALAEPPNDSV